MIYNMTGASPTKAPAMKMPHEDPLTRMLPGGGRILLALLVFSSLATPLQAYPASIRFDRLSIEQGLSQSTAYSILQDSRGFVWIGTQSGLNRYDGYRFVRFRHIPGDPASLSGSEVRALYEDRDGTLWAGTDRGLNRFDRSNHSFIRYQHDPKVPGTLSGNRVFAIHQDRMGRLWIGTDAGLDLFDRERKRFIRFELVHYGKSTSQNGRVRTIYEDRQGVLWIGATGGLNRFDPEAGTFEPILHDPQAVTSDNPVYAVLQDRSGRLWIGSQIGLTLYDPGSGSSRRFEPDPEDPYSLSEGAVKAILEDAHGTLWIGVHGNEGGMHRFEPETGGFVRYARAAGDPHSLSDNWIEDLYEDQAGVIWVGTWGGGVSKFDQTSLRFIHHRHDAFRPDSLSSREVYSFLQDREGNIWLGTDRGIDRFDPDSGRRLEHFSNDPADPRSLSHDLVVALHQDRGGTIWAGTLRGLNFFNPKGPDRSFINFRNRFDDPILQFTACSIYEDRRGSIWVGMCGAGLARFDQQGKRKSHYFHNPDDPFSLSDNTVRSIFEDSLGALWIGTDRGLNRLDPRNGRFKRFLHDPANPRSLSGNLVQALHEDSQGSLWVGTWGGGLNRFVRDKDEFVRFDEEQGLNSDSVNCILGDRQGHLWLSTNRGLTRFDPAQGWMRSFGPMDGLQGFEFNPNACLLTDDGRMLFGGADGFNVFRPEEIVDNPYLPPTVITGFRLFNQSVPLRRDSSDSPLEASIEESLSITLTHHDSVFSFEFASLHFASPERNGLEYKLENFNDEWMPADSRNPIATFTSLEAGEYVFRVRGSNSDGVWNPEGAAIRVEILPPIWKTRWAYAIYLLAASSGLLAYVHSHRRKLAHERGVNRRLAQEVQKRAELERIVGHSPAAAFLWRAKKGWPIEYVSENVRQFGFDPDGLVQGGSTFRSIVHPDDWTKLRKSVGDGIVDSTDDFVAEHRIVGADGEIRWVESHIWKQPGPGSEATHYQGLVLDISERKQMAEEQRRLKAQLRHAQKMETIGTLAGGIAHDFNNMLTPIVGYTEMAKMSAGKDDRVSLYLENVLKASYRARDLVKRILTFSRRAEQDRRRIEIASLVEEAIKLLQSVLPSTVEVRKRVDSECGVVMADPTQIHQVLMNLFANAGQAMRETGGVLEVNLRRVSAEARMDLKYPGLKEGPCAMLTVSDTGVGMDQDTVERIFEPFFTTKGPDEGTGLGLSVVHGIITSHEGAITVESRPGKGSTFTVCFPLLAGEAVEEASLEEAPPRGQERILLVDDEKMIARMLDELLSQRGFKVTSFSDSREALETFRESPRSFDLVITDQIMPGLTGAQLSTEVLKVRPDTPIILISGFSDQQVVTESMQAGIREYLMKPIEAGELCRAIRRAIDRPEEPREGAGPGQAGRSAVETDTYLNGTGLHPQESA